jgi:hypothetical protein
MCLFLFRWDNRMYQAANKDKSEQEANYQPGHRERPNTKDRQAMKVQAKIFLAGKETWAPTPKLEEWVDVGEPTEVETDIDLDISEELDAGPRKSDR